MTTILQIFQIDERQLDDFLKDDIDVRIGGKKISATILAYYRNLLPEYDIKIFKECKIYEIFDSFYRSILSGEIIKPINDELVSSNNEIKRLNDELNKLRDQNNLLISKLNLLESKKYEHAQKNRDEEHNLSLLESPFIIHTTTNFLSHISDS